jgi:hypothetical protein
MDTKEVCNLDGGPNTYPENDFFINYKLKDLVSSLGKNTTIKELKDLLKELNLNTTGKRSELMTRYLTAIDPDKHYWS